MHISRYTNQATRNAVISQQHAEKQAAIQSEKDSEYAHRANRSAQDDDEFRAACGLPPRRR